MQFLTGKFKSVSVSPFSTWHNNVVLVPFVSASVLTLLKLSPPSVHCEKVFDRVAIDLLYEGNP